VSPLRPELPEVAPPPVAVALPRMAELTAAGPAAPSPPTR